MFRTFSRTCDSPTALNYFLNSIVEDGYQPWIYREQPRAAWWGGQYRYVIDVYVTAYKLPEVLKVIPAETKG